ncbi:MAG: hypothetical protein ABEI53_01015 [Candidatus Magasanikbacteria bacterium]
MSSLVKCSGCREKVSINAESCPNCGQPNPGHRAKVKRRRKRQKSSNSKSWSEEPLIVRIPVSIVMGFLFAIPIFPLLLALSSNGIIDLPFNPNDWGGWKLFLMCVLVFLFIDFIFNPGRD